MIEWMSSVEAYVNELMGTSHKLTDAGYAIDDQWLGIKLLFVSN